MLAALGVAAFFVLWLYGFPLLGVEGMYAYEYRRAVVTVEAAGDKQRDLLESWFEDHRRELRLLSADETLARVVAAVQMQGLRPESRVHDALVRRLTALKESSPGTYRSIQIVDAVTGKPIAATLGEHSPPEDFLTWVQEASEPGITESVRIFGEVQHPRVMVIGQIARVDAQGSPDGKLLGLLVADMALDFPFQLSEGAMRQVLGDSGAVLLVNHDGQVLLKQSSAQSDEESGEVASTVVSGTEGVHRMTSSQGTELISVSRYIHLGASDELSIAVTRSADEALAGVRASFLRMSGLMALLFFLSMVLVVLAANRIASVESEIRTLNASLEERIETRTVELSQTRDELARSERLAALGSLVAGVAHELNTPLGNSLTVASTMQDEADRFQQAMGQGIKRSTLDAYVANTREGLEILMNGLRKAVDLVGSFKQVAVDQTSINLRTFRLRETVGEILMTLGPTVRRTPHRIETDIPDGIVMTSFPGPLGQIITNLINNALLHGLHDTQPGKITLAARMRGTDTVVLTVSDSGVGIPEAHLNRVFDPFFTTKLGQGGSGLGLNIVYNLVTQTLGGTVRVESPPGQGACFIITLPAVVAIAAPADGAADAQPLG